MKFLSLSVVGLNQLQQIGNWLDKEEVEMASRDHYFKKLEGKESRELGRQAGSGENVLG